MIGLSPTHTTANALNQMNNSDYASWLGARTCCSFLLVGSGSFLIVSGAQTPSNTPLILSGIASSILGLAACCSGSGGSQNTNRTCQNTSLLLASLSLLTASSSLIVAGTHSSQFQTAMVVSGASLAFFSSLSCIYALSQCFRHPNPPLTPQPTVIFNELTTLV